MSKLEVAKSLSRPMKDNYLNESKTLLADEQKYTQAVEKIPDAVKRAALGGVFVQKLKIAERLP